MSGADREEGSVVEKIWLAAGTSCSHWPLATPQAATGKTGAKERWVPSKVKPYVFFLVIYLQKYLLDTNFSNFLEFPQLPVTRLLGLCLPSA